MDTRVLAYNTRMASRDELPENLRRTLACQVERQDGHGRRRLYSLRQLLEMMGRERGVSFMKRLAQQDLIIRSGHSLLTQLIIAGEFPIYLDGFGSNIEKFKSQGAPIDWVPLEPVIVSLNPVGMAVNAPHPASASLLLDFLLSKEGQEVGRRWANFPPVPMSRRRIRGLLKGSSCFRFRCLSRTDTARSSKSSATFF